MKNSLSSELREVMMRRLRLASANEVIAIAGTLCANEELADAGELPECAIRVQSRFELEGDIVTDTLTGLQWTRANVAGGPMNWAAAKKAAEAVTLGGHSDWRLPTIRQLLSIVDYERSNPAIDPAFECDSAWYWSSTPYKVSPGGYAWIVYFGNGDSGWYGRTDGYRVRAVRAGQVVGSWAW